MKKILVAALATVIAEVCRAANPAPLPENLLACGKLQDPTERVRCYDAEIAALKEPATTPAKPAPVAPSAALPAAPSVRVVPAVPAGLPAVPAPPVAVPRAAAPAQFGEEQLPSKTRPAPPPKEEALASNITAIRTVGQKIYLITLANGQVWRQEGSQLPVLFKVGSAVRIERGAFGSYHLSMPALGDKNWVLVTRTQ